MRILLDPGHGAGKAFNRGGLLYNEGDNNYLFSEVLKRELEKLGVEVDTTRKFITANPSLETRARMGVGYDLFLSLHSNAASSQVRGSEIWDSVEKPNKELADELVLTISKCFGHNNRGTKYRKNDVGTNWYGVLRHNLADSAMILEMGFHTNYADCLYFKNNHQKLAVTIANVIKVHYKLKGGSNSNTTNGGGTITPPSTDFYRVRKSWVDASSQVGAYKNLDNAIEQAKKFKGYYVFDGRGHIVYPKPEEKKEPKKDTTFSIMGKSKASYKQLAQLVRSKNPNPHLSIPVKELAKIFLEEGEIEGVRGDIAFCQSIHETGYFKYGGQVLAEQNNFAGIGATNNSPKGKGAWFKTPREGVRAQIQHLKAYASKEPLKNPCVDPRFHLVTRGIAPNWVDLNGKWAVPGTIYGQSILATYHNLLAIKVKDEKEDLGSNDVKEIEILKKQLEEYKNKFNKIREILNS